MAPLNMLAFNPAQETESRGRDQAALKLTGVVKTFDADVETAWTRFCVGQSRVPA